MPDASHIGRYRLVRLLARGGMAEIFLAKQEGPRGFSKTVVVKRVLPELAENENFVRMFLDEATLAAHLSHPNVVQITDFGEVDGTYFLAMEFLQGDDLGTLLRRQTTAPGELPFTVAALIASGVAEGLHYAHTLKGEEGNPLRIVHRDVSPNNIFVTHQGSVKVLDFGIAMAEGKLSKTRAGVVKGKAMYMSPEQTRGAAVDGRSDVFALGVVLYEMVTGVRPFARDAGDYAILTAIIEEEPRPAAEVNPAVPLALSEIIRRAMAKSLDARFQSALELRKELDAFVAGFNTAPAAGQLQDFMVQVLGTDRIAADAAAQGSDTDPGAADTDPEAKPDPEVGVVTRIRSLDGLVPAPSHVETRVAELPAPEAIAFAETRLLERRAAGEKPRSAASKLGDATFLMAPPPEIERPRSEAPAPSRPKVGDETMLSAPAGAGEETVRVPAKRKQSTGGPADPRSLGIPLAIAVAVVGLLGALTWYALKPTPRTAVPGTDVVEVLPTPTRDAGR